MSLVCWLLMPASKKVWLTSLQLLKNKKVFLLEVCGGGFLIQKDVSCNFSFS